MTYANAARVPFDAVIFDCDGVLIDSERLINDVEAQLFSRLGLGLSPWVQLDLPRPVSAMRRRTLLRRLRMCYGEK